MNKKFILIIAAFTITVPGFFLFSYWFLGIFSGMDIQPLKDFKLVVYASEHNGDYNKTGEKVVQTRKLLLSYAIPCKPVLVYYENAITTGKPYLRSLGGCSVSEILPAHVTAAMSKNGIQRYEFDIRNGYTLKTYAQTAIALRKVWNEIARLSDKGVDLKFPLLHMVHDDGTNEFVIAAGAK